MQKLNLPILEDLENAENILLMGMGGGYDVFCGLPIFYELQKHKNLFLGNFSSTNIVEIKSKHKVNKYLLEVSRKNIADNMDSFCELYLSEWLEKQGIQNPSIYAFQKTGVKPLFKSFQQIIKKYKIDTIILVDGGVDSLIKGDEQEQGTLLEDLTSICAVDLLAQNIKKYLITLGFGAERDIFYGDIFQNIAELSQQEGFLGSCSLINTMPSYQFYKEAVLYVQNHSHQNNSSVINSSVISAVEGKYGDFHLIDKTKGSVLWINPLMSMYWCFDLSKIAQWNLLNEKLKTSKSFDDVVKLGNELKNIQKRKSENHISFEQSERD